MNLTIENIVLIGSLLLFISIIAGKTSNKLGVPTLILFLAIGMLSGSEGIGGIHFDDPKTTQFIGIIALNFILFSGGLDTNWNSVKPILGQGISLATLGVILTALTLGTFVWLITNFTFYESLLLGAIVSSTDAASVFSMLRSKNLDLKSNLRPTLELESGSNDPMAYVLTIAFLSLLVHQELSFYSVIPLFFQQMILGTVGGFIFGKISKLVINRIKLNYEGLYPALIIALMFITFSATDAVGGNGFLAVYICAVYLGNQELIHKKTILKMYDGLAWLMQIILFLTLGLLVNPSHILPVMGIGILISLFLIFVARPLSVLLSLLPFQMKQQRRLYISWVGLRGAVPIVFATYPLLAGIEKAEMIFNIVFFIALTSLLIQGSTLTVVAKWLRVALPETENSTGTSDSFVSEDAKKVMTEIEISQENCAVGKEIVELRFPKSATIAMIKRKEHFLTPNGATIIEANDILVVLSETQEEINTVYEFLQLQKPTSKII